MATVFGGAEGGATGDQINLTFQKMAGQLIRFKFNFICKLIPRFGFAEAAALAVQGFDETANVAPAPQIADSLTEALKVV